MKISITISFFPKTASGGHKVIFEYANYLVSRGHEVVLYIANSDIFLQKYPLPQKIRRIGQKYIVEKKNIGWFQLDSRIKRIAVSEFSNAAMEDADIVFATAVETALPVANLAQSKGKKCYLIQDFENWSFSDAEVYKTYALGMKNIVISKWLKDLADKYSHEKSVLISNAIDTAVYKCNIENDKRPEHSVIFHYRKAQYKGSKYAIETLRILKEKYKDLVVYAVCNEKNVESIPDFCNIKYNLNARQVVNFNNKARVFMCSSIEEGFGLPGLEAMACGCALVTTDYRGGAEYAVNEKNALVSPVRDANTMAENIIRLFENDDLRNSIVNEGIKTAKSRDLLRAGTELEKVLSELLMN